MENGKIEKIIEQVAERAAKRAIEAYRTEQRAQESQKAYNMTFKLLKQYGNLLYSRKSAAAAAGEPENEFTALIRKSEKSTSAVLTILESAVQEIEKEIGQTDRYRAFDMYFFQKMTYEQITEVIPVGDSTPRRWISEIVGILAVKIFGTEAIR